jgi:hypothetical protein
MVLRCPPTARGKTPRFLCRGSRRATLGISTNLTKSIKFLFSLALETGRGCQRVRGNRQERQERKANPSCHLESENLKSNVQMTDQILLRKAPSGKLLALFASLAVPGFWASAVSGRSLLLIFANYSDTSPTCFDSMSPSPRRSDRCRFGTHSPQTGEGPSLRGCVTIFSNAQ